MLQEFLSLRVHVLPWFQVLLIIAQVPGKYMIIWYLDPEVFFGLAIACCLGPPEDLGNWMSQGRKGRLGQQGWPLLRLNLKS